MPFSFGELLPDMILVFSRCQGELSPVASLVAVETCSDDICAFSTSSFGMSNQVLASGVK